MVADSFPQLSCSDILTAWRSHQMSRRDAVDRLTQQWLAVPAQTHAFGIEEAHCRAWVDQLLDRYQEVFPSFCEVCQQTLKISPYPISTLWNLWLPLALNLAHLRNTLQRPIIQGVLGGQGTGKTTLATILTAMLTQMGYRVCGLSIDDLYKTYADRQNLMKHDPRLQWRGPPGTHDIELGLKVLRQIKQPDRTGPIAIPRFDKSLHGGAGDRTDPDRIEGADIVLFEGWFVGARPADPAVFDQAPPPITTAADRQFARDTNVRLHEYLPLWDELDRLMVLYPTDYRLSQQWRQQAEHKMKATGKAGMSDDEIQIFVEYFWRSLHPDLFITPLLHQPEHVDLVVEVNPDRSIRTIYRPGDQDEATD